MPFFSQQQGRLFINGLLVDDCVTFEYSAHQQKLPIYGYKSRDWDRIVKGKFYIQGAFTISFRETGYLFRLLSLGRGDPLTQEAQDILDGVTYLPEEQAENVPRFVSLEDQLSEMKKNNPSMYDAVRDEFETRIWEVRSAQYPTTRIDLHDDVGRGFLKRTSNILDKLDFEMSVRYGSTSLIETFHEVRISNVSKVIAPNGEPLLEKYDFLARDMNEDLDFEDDIASLSVSSRAPAGGCPAPPQDITEDAAGTLVGPPEVTWKTQFRGGSLGSSSWDIPELEVKKDDLKEGIWDGEASCPLTGDITYVSSITITVGIGGRQYSFILDYSHGEFSILERDEIDASLIHLDSGFFIGGEVADFIRNSPEDTATPDAREGNSEDYSKIRRFYQKVLRDHFYIGKSYQVVEMLEFSTGEKRTIARYSSELINVNDTTYRFPDIFGVSVDVDAP